MATQYRSSVSLSDLRWSLNLRGGIVAALEAAMDRLDRQARIEGDIIDYRTLSVQVVASEGVLEVDSDVTVITTARPV